MAHETFIDTSGSAHRSIYGTGHYAPNSLFPARGGSGIGMTVVTRPPSGLPKSGRLLTPGRACDNPDVSDRKRGIYLPMLTPDLQDLRIDVGSGERHPTGNRSGSSRRRPVLLACCLALMCMPSAARAARPMVTDDARITDPYACQLEAWQKVLRGSREYWAFPACNPTGNLEITLGVNDLPGDDGGRVTDYVLQGKTLFREFETNSYGWGLAAGIVRHADPMPGQGRTGATYFYLPYSASFRDDLFIVHLNLGAQDNRDRDAKPVIYGAGTEINFTRRFALIAEIYGDSLGSPYYQAGVRIWVVPGRFQIDATQGARFGDFGESRWWTIGVRLISPPFLK